MAITKLVPKRIVQNKTNPFVKVKKSGARNAAKKANVLKKRNPLTERQQAAARDAANKAKAHLAALKKAAAAKDKKVGKNKGKENDPHLQDAQSGGNATVATRGNASPQPAPPAQPAPRDPPEARSTGLGVGKGGQVRFVPQPENNESMDFSFY